MQAAMGEPDSSERVASPVAGESGLSCDELANRIKVSVSKGDQYHKAAGLLLLEAKQRLLEFGLTWPAFLVGKCHLERSRAYVLIAIAEGRTTEEAEKAKGRERAARHAAKNKAARSSVSNGQSPSPDPLSEQRSIVTSAMKDASLADWTTLAKCATEIKSARDTIKDKADRDTVAVKPTTAPRTLSPDELKDRSEVCFLFRAVASAEHEREQAYTRLIKTRSLYEGACELSWAEYFEYREAHPGCEPLARGDLAYARQWTPFAVIPETDAGTITEKALRELAGRLGYKVARRGTKYNLTRGEDDSRFGGSLEGVIGWLDLITPTMNDNEQEDMTARQAA
jgi:ribosomal protein L17